MSAPSGSSLSYDDDLAVLILKSSARPLHHGALAVIRSLGRAKVPVYCCIGRGTPPVAWSRYLSRDPVGVLRVDTPAAAIAQLQAFQRRLDRPVAIVPVDDAGALFLAETAAHLGAAFRLPQQPPDAPRTAASKANLPRLCAISGTPTPFTVVLGPADDLVGATAGVRYPALVKIAEPWLLPPDVRPALLVQSQAEALRYRASLGSGSPAAIVVQEFIPHGATEDWFYHGYHAAGGEPVVGFTGRKLRSHPAFVGATSYGISVVNPTVRSLSQALLRRLGYAGIVELEFCFDKRDGLYKLIDFNPRLGAQFQFLRDTNGVDVVRALHLHLSGRAVPDAPQVEGRAFISDFTDLAVFGAYRRRGLLSAGDWIRQMIGAEHAWFAADDPAPLAAATVYFGAAFVRQKARRTAPAQKAPRRPANRPRPTTNPGCLDPEETAV